VEYGSYRIPWNKRKILILFIFLVLGLFIILFAPKDGWGIGKVNIWILFLVIFMVWFQYSRDYIYAESYEWIKRNVMCPVCGGRMVKCQYAGGSRSGDIYNLQCGSCGKEFILGPKFGRSGLVLQDKEKPMLSGIWGVLVGVVIVVCLLLIVLVLFLLKVGW